MKRVRRLLVLAAAMLVALAAGVRPVGADCPPEKSKPKVVFVGVATGKFDKDTAAMLSDAFFTDVFRQTPGVSWVLFDTLPTILGLDSTREAAGGEVDLSELAGAFGSQFILQLKFRTEQNAGEAPVHTVTGTLVNTSDGSNVRRFQTRFEIATGFATVSALAAQMTPNLLCDLLGRRKHPVVPVVAVEVTPHEVAPNATVHVKVTLTDESDGQVQPGKDVRIANRHEKELVGSETAETNLFGVAEVDVNVGPDPGDGSIEASFTDSRGRTAKSNPEPVPYHVRDTTGDMTVSAPESALILGAAASVTAHATVAGLPISYGVITFASAGGGSVAKPTVAADANGVATTQYQAPNANAVVDVTASTPRPPSKGPKTGAADLTASLTFVVDGGVTMNLNALDTLAGGTSDVTADLVVGGTAIPGADVTFTLSGAGALSAPSAPTDDAGRAEVTWIAPAGNSSATITATTVVDGQTYTKSVTVHAAPAAPMTVVLVGASGSADSDPWNSGGCEGGVGATDLSLPFTYSGSYCTHDWNMSLKLTSPTTLEFSDEFNELDRTFANDAVTFDVTYARAGTVTFDIEPGWAVAAPDPFPGYSFMAQLSTDGAKFYVYSFTHASGTAHGSAVVAASSKVRYSFSVSGSNDAANAGSGKLLTLTFTPDP